jgi:hypothetical protein
MSDGKSTAIANIKNLRVRYPRATRIVAEAFSNAHNLIAIDTPKVEAIEYSAFANCDSLTLVDLPKVYFIGDSAFSGCTSLHTIILRNTEAVCQIMVTAVLGTKIATADGVPTGEGFVYVPSALYEGYVEWVATQTEQMVGDAATAEYMARAVLRKIEDYPEICG